MTSTAIPQAVNAELRAILRKRAGEWLARSYRHDLLVARTVRGMQVEAQQEFDRMVVAPLLKAIGGTLATFGPRGSDVIPEAFPQIAALQREIAQVIDRGAESVHRLTQRRMAAVVQVEAAWTRGTATALGGGIAPPAANVATAERQAIDRPFLGDKTERWFEKMLSGPTKDNVRAWVNAGIQQGLTTDEIVRGLRGTKEQTGILADKPKYAVAALVRTAATHASQVGREAGFKAIGVTHYRFRATLDSLTSIQCAANDGKVFEMGKGPVPPLHPNCFPGDTLVTSVCSIAGVSKRWFDGEAWTIRTASGRVLTGTPNHPILTDRGWVGIGSLAVGDHVVCDGGSQWRGLGDGDNQNVPPTIHEVAESFLASGSVASCPVPVSAPHFHGDVADGDVAVVGADRRLRPVLHAALVEHRRELDLVSADGLRSVGGPLGQLASGRLPAPDGSVGGSSEGLPIGCAGVRHPGELLLAPTARGSSIGYECRIDAGDVDTEALGDPCGSDPSVEHGHRSGMVEGGHFGDWGPLSKGGPAGGQGAVDDLRADAALAGKIASGASGAVFTDEVVDVGKGRFAGHVFNLETVGGFYSANGIIVHNCRSATEPVWDPKEKPDGDRASIDGPVPADQSFEDWLGQQSKKDQDEALGKTKAEAWRSGKLPLAKMLGADLQPLTLAELRELDRI